MENSRVKYSKYGSDVLSYSIPDGDYEMEITRWRLRDRDYEIEIIVPITSVQPDNVKVAFGQKGRNLVETHVTCDDITEKTIKFQEIVRVSR